MAPVLPGRSSNGMNKSYLALRLNVEEIVAA